MNSVREVETGLGKSKWDRASQNGVGQVEMRLSKSECCESSRNGVELVENEIACGKSERGGVSQNAVMQVGMG